MKYLLSYICFPLIFTQEFFSVSSTNTISTVALLYLTTLKLLLAIEHNFFLKRTLTTALIQRNEIDVKEFGNDVTVAENEVAKLMYYLNCVCLTVDCNDDPDIRRFTDYHHWSNLSIDEQKRLLVLCYALSPDVLENKVFFQSDTLCQGSPNRLYKVSQVRHQLLVASTVLVAGRTRQVNKIMAYTIPWMQYCYLQPMQELVRRFAGQDQQRQPRQRGSSRCTIF